MWPFRSKNREFTEIKEELMVICREWFQCQVGDLPADERPPQEEIEQDIIQMRDETYHRVISAVPRKKFLRDDGRPSDAENARALKLLVERYAGHEDSTPIFTKLALAKVSEPRYQSGWPLCMIRLVAETWLDQSAA